ncbi:MAG: TRAP transporter substrate-binding protein [Nitrospinaceae bacterium]|nr:TRAP transporter substrate-binding protein [Nitrospinaceae bacterium]MBT3433340.1 TRAP transporter substrate-binding protein [Nitrospinaceae bacterium]MBT3820456.1 TRAP transporter substrate-binding protein [Nitrospinaceae bacterium]MBT4429547.1 TRAP transporter substrate-binding protein [Nitrospinaceae bacterium]MBT5367787.1 TRAP transporter substrate-binding protein [Nitrospinaceae bacterium]
MSNDIHIRFAGYSPPHTTHSRAIVRFRDALISRLGDSARVDIFWNVLDFGYKGLEMTKMVENGQLTMCYSSTAYGLSDIIPELQIIDLPFIFDNEEHAHRALDGELGKFLTQKIEEKKNFRMLGYWDNGFRHISNSRGPIRAPEDCAGLRIRLMPNEIHKKTFELLGALPRATNLHEGLAMMESGELDAQENPLANTAAYGMHRFHDHITMTGHFYAARGIFANRDAVDSWPSEVRAAVNESIREAIIFQREAAREEEIKMRGELESEGISFIELSSEERARFKEAVSPVVDQARKEIPGTLFQMLG